MNRNRIRNRRNNRNGYRRNETIKIPEKKEMLENY